MDASTVAEYPDAVCDGHPVASTRATTVAAIDDADPAAVTVAFGDHVCHPVVTVENAATCDASVVPVANAVAVDAAYRAAENAAIDDANSSVAVTLAAVSDDDGHCCRLRHRSSVTDVASVAANPAATCDCAATDCDCYEHCDCTGKRSHHVRCLSCCLPRCTSSCIRCDAIGSAPSLRPPAVSCPSIRWSPLHVPSSSRCRFLCAFQLANLDLVGGVKALIIRNYSCLCCTYQIFLQSVADGPCAVCWNRLRRRVEDSDGHRVVD